MCLLPATRPAHFYPRSPCGERLITVGAGTMILRFLSTLSLRRATLVHIDALALFQISIHALLAESDFNGDHGHMSGDISIHALLAESDPQDLIAKELALAFLSTLSLRRATAVPEHVIVEYLRFLSTLSLRRATFFVFRRIASLEHFYPRSPCGERLRKIACDRFLAEFLSTLSLRRATVAILYLLSVVAYFYPRSPCGERRNTVQVALWHKQFLSTLSLRRATVGDVWACRWPEFLSTLSLRRATCDIVSIERCSLFLSTLSLRRATQPSSRGQKAVQISIHALLAESDVYGCYSFRHSAQFLSTLSLRRATSPLSINYMIHTQFLSTLSLRRATAPSITPTASRRNFYPRSPCGERPSAKSTPEEA